MPVIETSGDTSQSGAGGRERLIPAGYLHLKINESPLGTTKNGHPQVTIKGEIVAHESDPRAAGRKATVFQVQGAKSAPYTKRMLDAAGFERLDRSASPQMVQGVRRYIEHADKIVWDTDALAGCVVRVECTHDEWEPNKWSERWGNWSPSQYAPQPGHVAPGQGVPYQGAPQQYAPPQGAPQGPYASAPYMPGAGNPPPRR